MKIRNFAEVCFILRPWFCHDCLRFQGGVVQGRCVAFDPDENADHGCRYNPGPR